MHNSASLRGQAARLFDYLQSRTEPVDSDQIRRDLVIVNISKLATSINAHLASQGVTDRVVCLHRGRLPALWSLMSVADARDAAGSPHDLLNNSYADRLIEHGDGYVCKTADATWPILVEQQRRRRDSLVEQAESLDRERKRMAALMAAGMEVDPQMTVGDAMALMAGGDA